MKTSVQSVIGRLRHGIVPMGYCRTECGTVPRDWTKFYLGDIYTERNEPGNENLPLLMVSIHSGVSDGEVDEEQLTKKFKRIEDKTQYKRAESGDLVFNMMRAWQGAVGTVRTRGMVSPAYIVAKPGDMVDPLFMNFYMRTDRMIKSIHRQSYGVTDFRLRLYWDSFAAIPCVLPPLPEQRKIAAILATQDKVIELKAKLLEETKRRKKALMQRLLAPMEEKRLEAASPCGEAASCRFGDNNKLVFMDDIGFTYSGLTGMSKADFVKGNAWYIPFLNVLKNTKIDLERLEQVNISESEKQTEVRKGDLLFNISSETPNEVGLCAYLANDVEYTYLNSFCIGFRLKPDAKIEPHYLVEWFNSCYGRRIMRSLAQGATRYNLSRECLLAIPIILPPIAVQRRIVAVLSTADREIDLMEKELNALELKKKALTQLLLTGIVRVGEAASCRLERAGNEAAGSRFSTRIAKV